MQTDYTDDQTARARELEKSSAGYQTQPLTLPPSVAPTPVPSRGRSPLGLAMVLLGGVVLIGYLLNMLFGWSVIALLLLDSGELQAGLILLTISSCFLFFAFWRRIYPLFIPGCVLLGLSVGVPLADLTDGVSVLWGLSLAFLAIFGIGRTLFPQLGKATIWPIFPSIILFAVGTIIAIANGSTLLLSGVALLPLLLIALGIALGMRRPPGG
ncbi:MAG: hypothetical protein H7Z42_10785 [Roseiflexaceae bacterium]|nr:hypothetical protein [Roseiflexaceae bacterium]